MRDVVRMRPEFGGSNFAMPRGLTEVVVDPETGMAASQFCPHRESAVVPTSAATSVNCFKHQPLETMYAMANVNELDPSVAPYSTTIEATEVAPTNERDTRQIVEYEEYSGSDDRLNVRRPTPGTSRESTVTHVRTEESYLEQYERNQRKEKKPE